MDKKRLPNALKALKEHEDGGFNKKDMQKPLWEAFWESLEDEKSLQKRAETCAKELAKIFKNFKRETIVATQFDLYRDNEWRKVIQSLLKWSKDKWVDYRHRFDLLEIKLKNLWLEGTRPSYSYFSENRPYPGSAWYRISQKDDAREKEIGSRVGICWDKLISVFENSQNKNKDPKEWFSIALDSEDWKMIVDFLEWISSEYDVATLFDSLNGYLLQKWYHIGYSDLQLSLMNWKTIENAGNIYIQPFK